MPLGPTPSRLRQAGRAKGHTLPQLLLYSVLSVAALAVMTSLLTVARHTGAHNSSQSLVSGDLATAIRTLRKELQATSLGSIEVHETSEGQMGGFSFISAYDDKGEFRLSVNGTPHWQKNVNYTLDSQGRVSRWTRELTGGSHSRAGDGRTLLHNALPPNTPAGVWQPASKFGGLEVGFVLRQGGREQISRQNPRHTTRPEQATPLVEVVLRALDPEGPDFTEIKFRVAPRY